MNNSMINYDSCELVHILFVFMKFCDNVLVAVLQGMDALVVPPLRGMLSKMVSMDDQGRRMMGCNYI